MKDGNIESSLHRETIAKMSAFRKEFSEYAEKFEEWNVKILEILMPLKFPSLRINYETFRKGRKSMPRTLYTQSL